MESISRGLTSRSLFREREVSVVVAGEEEEQGIISVSHSAFLYIVSIRNNDEQKYEPVFPDPRNLRELSQEF
jgi:hypothetical protein